MQFNSKHLPALAAHCVWGNCARSCGADMDITWSERWKGEMGEQKKNPEARLLGLNLSSASL